MVTPRELHQPGSELQKKNENRNHAPGLLNREATLSFRDSFLVEGASNGIRMKGFVHNGLPDESGTAGKVAVAAREPMKRPPSSLALKASLGIAPRP